MGFSPTNAGVRFARTITCRNGRVLHAADYGLKAFPIRDRKAPDPEVPVEPRNPKRRRRRDRDVPGQMPLFGQATRSEEGGTP